MEDDEAVIDVDTHFNEVSDTWSTIDPGFRDRRLEIRCDESGRRWLLAGDRRILRVRNTHPGDVDEAREILRAAQPGFEEMLDARQAVNPATIVPHASESDAAERIKTLDAMGVTAALLFPSFGLFWPTVIDDSEVADANYAAWNTWIAARTAGRTERLLGVAQYSLADVDRAVAEIRRCGELGLAGLFLRTVPYRKLPWGDPSNEPVWEALESSGMPLLLHAAPQGSTAADPAWEKGMPSNHVGQTIQTFLNRPCSVEAVLSNLIFEGVLERHPRLRIGALEYGSTWVPSFLQRLDFTFDFLAPRNRYLRERLTLRPSEYVRRQVKVSAFWSEPLEWLFAASSSELFMYASDFPHPEGNERAVDHARRALGGAPREDRRRFFSENARALLSNSRRSAPGG